MASKYSLYEARQSSSPFVSSKGALLEGSEKSCLTNESSQDLLETLVFQADVNSVRSPRKKIAASSRFSVAGSVLRGSSAVGITAEKVLNPGSPVTKPFKWTTPVKTNPECADGPRSGTDVPKVHSVDPLIYPENGSSWSNHEHSDYIATLEENFLNKMFGGYYCEEGVCGRPSRATTEWIVALYKQKKTAYQADRAGSVPVRLTGKKRAHPSSVVTTHVGAAPLQQKHVESFEEASAQDSEGSCLAQVMSTSPSVTSTLLGCQRSLLDTSTSTTCPGAEAQPSGPEEHFRFSRDASRATLDSSPPCQPVQFQAATHKSAGAHQLIASDGMGHHGEHSNNDSPFHTSHPSDLSIFSSPWVVRLSSPQLSQAGVE